MSTEATLGHHLQAFGEGIDALVSDYGEESVIFAPDGPAVGLAEVRAFFEGFVAGLPDGFFDSFTILRQDIHGEHAYLLWKAEPWVALGVDALVVRDGTIVAQFFASHPGA